MGEPTDLYERLYFHEIEVREQINSRLQMPLSLIFVLAGAFAYLLQGADHTLTSEVTYLFRAALVLMGTALLVGACLFARAAWWHNYLFVPYARHTANSWKELKEYDAKYGTTIADSKIAEYLRDYFIEGATTNATNNDRRSGYLHWSNMALVATSGFALVAFLAFALGDLGRKAAVAQVSITQPIDVRAVNIPDKFMLVPADVALPTIQIAPSGGDPSNVHTGVPNASTGRTTAATAATASDAASSGRGQTATPTAVSEDTK